LAPISTAEQVSPAAPMSWMAMTQSLAMISRQASSNNFLRERIADLHGGALFFGSFAKFGRCHGGAVDTVAAGLGAEIDDRHADAGSRGVENLVAAREADRHRIDEAVAVIAGVKTTQPPTVGTPKELP